MSGAPLAVALAGAARDAVRTHVGSLVADQVASKLFAQDDTLWGPDAQDEASKRLAWVTLASGSRPLVERVEALRAELAAEGLTRVVLCGMGGSSLAPEVITSVAGKQLTVLDGTDPEQVARVVGEDLASTVVVVSSKSGSTLETDSQRRAFAGAFEAAGIDAASRFVVVTDPGSALGDLARENGYRAVVEADPEVGGRYSALTAFGLVPSGLAGVDLGALLDDAASAAAVLGADSDENPALTLGAALGGSQGRTKVAIVEDGSGLVGFGDWAEQLIAESTGKLGTGILPVVVGPQDLEVTDTPSDVLLARLVADAADASLAQDGAQVAVSGGLGAQMLLWEAAVAVAGRLLGINPFDQPDVESAKVAAREMLDGGSSSGGRDEPAFVQDGIEVRGTPGLLDGVEDVAGALSALLDRLDQPSDEPAADASADPAVDGGYLAVMAYLDREAYAPLADVRASLARRTGRPVTFGWAPRFLHSTGQYHKGGRPTGVFLQVTAAPEQDLGIPERDFGFGQLIAAQAAGDASVLADHDRPVLRLHLVDRGAALQALTDALGAR